MEKQEKIDIIKRHITNVISEEQKKYRTNPEFFIFDKKDYLEDSKLIHLNNKYNLIRNNKLLENALRYTGYFNYFKHIKFNLIGGYTDGKKITILLNDKTFKNDFNDQLYFKILATFHEFRHIGQKEEFDITNIEKPITNFHHFRYLLEDNCLRYLPPSYALAHDDFYFEIDANLYGIEKTDEYCAKNNISAIEYQRRYKQRQYSKMITYDFDKFINLNRLITFSNQILANKFSKNPTYGMFFNKNGRFNKLSDITKNPLFYSLDDKLKMEMLTSNSFLSSIDYDLNDVEKNFLLENIDKKLSDLVNNYNKNKEYSEKGVFDENIFIDNSSLLLSKMDFLLNFKINNSKTIDNKDFSYIKFNEEIKNIRSACEVNRNSNLTYDNLLPLDNQLNNIITTLNTFMNDKSNLKNTQQLSTTIKTLQEAMLAKVDINSIPLTAEYEPIVNEKDNNKSR